MKSEKSYAYRGAMNIVAVCMSMTIAANCDADERLFEIADKAARDGRLSDMQLAYEQALLAEPMSIRAMTGRAAALAWQGQYKEARRSYVQALQIDRQNVDALTGLGYAYAWDAEYSKAHTQFRRALDVDPTNSNARKGIAYSYFWDGDFELALDSFELAESIAPQDAEIAEASGQVLMSLGRSRDALSSFDKALRLDPGRVSAIAGRRHAGTSAPVLEVTSRFGTTSNAGSGIRGLEIAHWPAPATRFAIRYDNSLSLDNPSLSRRGEDVPSYIAALQQTFLERWTVTAEVGRRNHVDGDENLVSLQGAYSASSGVIRLGATIGHHETGHNNKQVFAGFNFPMGDRWRLEPTVYFARTGPEEDDEWRGVINMEYWTGSFWRLGGVVGIGEITTANAAFDGSTRNAGIWGSVLIADRQSLYISFRHEQSPIASISVAELGFTYRLPGN